MLFGISLALALSISSFSRASDAFPPCPLLGPNYPQPSGVASSAAIQNATSQLKKLFDEAIASGNSSHGPLGQETTSFSIGLFTASSGDGDGERASNSSQSPFFWEYHYTAPTLLNSSLGTKRVDADSVYRIGSMTQVFTVWTLLVKTGERYLDWPVTEFVPELAAASQQCDSSQSPLSCVDWCEVTLRDLGSHMAGIGRDFGLGDLSLTLNAGEVRSLGLPPTNASRAGSPACGNGTPCSRDEFFAGFLQRAPVYQPASSPILSDVAFQILAYALEKINGGQQSFDELVQQSILSPLGLGNSSVSFSAPVDVSHAVIPSDNATESGWSLDLGDLGYSLGLYSNLRDFGMAGRAMLSSTLLKPVQTRRWFKPVTLTSNPVNSNGIPWEIYSQSLASDGVSGPILDIRTYIGNLKGYSSYIGLTPNYNVGFVILSAGSGGITPDLNAHADFVGDALVPALERLAATQALANHAGNYTDGSTGAKLTITPSKQPGLEVASFYGANGTDLKASLAKLNDVPGGADELSFRLYPTDLQTSTSRAFRAVYQDEGAFQDAGTPTCISWMGVDGLVFNGQALDRFIFNYDEKGAAVSLEIPGFGLTLKRVPS